MNTKSAFSLIELLVVIAIIALLTAILVPASFVGIEMARRSSCANNLKTLGSAFFSYAADHKGALPHINPLGYDFTEAYPFTHHVVMLYVQGYDTDLRLYHCPSDKTSGGLPVFPQTDISQFDSLQNCSYLYIAGHHMISSRESPGIVPVLADESNRSDQGRGSNIGNMPEIGPDDNHGANIRNVLYLDGRVVTHKDPNSANAIFFNFKYPQYINTVD